MLYIRYTVVSELITLHMVVYQVVVYIMIVAPMHQFQDTVTLMVHNYLYTSF